MPCVCLESQPAIINASARTDTVYSLSAPSGTARITESFSSLATLMTFKVWFCTQRRALLVLPVLFTFLCYSLKDIVLARHFYHVELLDFGVRMNKAELCAKIAELAVLSDAQAKKAVTAFCNVVMEAIASGDSVQLVGFGTYSAKDRLAREGRNPKTGETIKIAACKVPHFKAGIKFKDAVNT